MDLTIPIRSSSKRQRQLSEEEILEGRVAVLNKSLKKAKKGLKPHASFDAKYWTAQENFYTLKEEHEALEKELELMKFTGTPQQWEMSKAATDHIQRERFNKMKLKTCRSQIERIQKGLSDSAMAASTTFMQFFTTSKKGLGIDSGEGRRDSSMQSNFRSQLIEKFNSKHDDPKVSDLWCPITKAWLPASATTAAHLFSYKHGQTAMVALFGEDAKDELFSPYNGLLIATSVEDLFDDGLLAIIPNLPDDATSEQLTAWKEADPKSYKIRILDPENDKLKNKISAANSMMWKDLDGETLEFRSAFRPRARYLFYHFCTHLLKFGWREKTGMVMESGFGKQYWGTSGKYVAKCMIRTLVKEIGYEYSDLEEAGKDIEEEVPGEDNFFLLHAAADEVFPPEDDDSSDEESGDEELDEESGR